MQFDETAFLGGLNGYPSSFCADFLGITCKIASIKRNSKIINIEDIPKRKSDNLFHFLKELVWRKLK